MSIEVARAIGDICMERDKQIAIGHTRANDDTKNGNGELAKGAAMYAYASTLDRPARDYTNSSFAELQSGGVMVNILRVLWPSRWTSPKFHNRRQHLVIAAALLVAEIERLDREKEKLDKADREMAEQKARVDAERLELSYNDPHGFRASVEQLLRPFVAGKGGSLV